MDNWTMSGRTKLVVSGLLSGIAVAALTAVVTLAPQPAAAKPEYAAQTKLPCGQCHVNPAGGGNLKPFGQKFQANGHKLK
jgi:hypothetical protein